MKVQMFCVFDSKSEAFTLPFFKTTKGEAVRDFGDAVNDPKSPWFRHPEDFTLFHVGEFDDQSATVASLKTPVSLGLASEYVHEPVAQAMRDGQAEIALEQSNGAGPLSPAGVRNMFRRGR